MVKEFKFPDVGEGIAEGEIVEWLVQEGGWVKEDQDLVEVETDKAVVTLPSPHAGKILKLHGRPGSIIRVGGVLATIEEEQEQPKRKDPGTIVGELAEAEEEKSQEPKHRRISPDVLALPGIRMLAKELGVDLSRAKGTGPDGRITRVDLERARTATHTRIERLRDSYGPVERVPLRGIRQKTAQHVAQASRRAVHVTIWADADITDLERVKAREKVAVAEKGVRLTYLPFVIKAVVPALKEHPTLNASLDDEQSEIILKKYYHVGIAVETPNGLVVFVITEADQKTILDLARDVESLAEKARQGKLELGELKGSTFTVTNYGTSGASYGTPILNDPEVAILGMGKIEDKAVVREGKIAIRKILPLSLSFDHRLIDGLEAGRFLSSAIRHLEDPSLLLTEGK